MTTGTQSDYSVGVTIDYDWSLIENGFSSSTPLQVALIPFYETYDGYYIDNAGIVIQTLTPDTFRNDSDGSDMRTTVYFDTYSYSTFKVLVWYDINYDNWIDIDSSTNTADEPGVLALANDTGNFWLDFRYQNPQGAGKNMSCYVSFDSVVNVQQLIANPYADYGTGGYAPYASIYNNYGSSSVAAGTNVIFYPYNSYDQDGWVTAWQWTVVDQYGSEIASGNSPEFSYTFSSEGQYYVRLVVTDNQSNVSDYAEYGMYVYSSGGGTEYTYDENAVTTTSGNITEWNVWIDTPRVYYVHWDDSYSGSGTYTGDCAVAAKDQSGNLYFDYTDSGYYSPVSIYVSSAQTITVLVNPMYSEGSTRVWITYNE